MRPLVLALTVCTVSLLAACTAPEPTTYPVSGQPCAPEDPVHDLGPDDCTPQV